MPHAAHPPQGARLHALEYSGTAQGHDVTDRVEFFGECFTANKPVMLRVDHLPGDARGIVFTVTGAPSADPYGFVDFDDAPPWLYGVRAGCAEHRKEERGISYRAL